MYVVDVPINCFVFVSKKPIGERPEVGADHGKTSEEKDGTKEEQVENVLNILGLKRSNKTTSEKKPKCVKK